eukprot:TRINITY_DN2484_c1_g1_i1.p3 TRINITY_DN2484_c1_g1~~TRINITY_DN2484_c1_g1_i1.p3  ORF type:complete len:145 (+),score=27.97 TRINITY_DN2484_c1_g1_i1:38-472(+)
MPHACDAYATHLVGRLAAGADPNWVAARLLRFPRHPELARGVSEALSDAGSLPESALAPLGRVAATLCRQGWAEPVLRAGSTLHERMRNAVEDEAGELAEPGSSRKQSGPGLGWGAPSVEPSWTPQAADEAAAGAARQRARQDA